MGELEMASPESLGIPSENFLEFYRQLSINKLPLHHFIFLRHGKIASMGSWHPYTEQMNHIMYSTSKTVTSLAVGLCVDDGLLNLETHIVDLNPSPALCIHLIRCVRYAIFLPCRAEKPVMHLPLTEAIPTG